MKHLQRAAAYTTHSRPLHHHSRYHISLIYHRHSLHHRLYTVSMISYYILMYFIPPILPSIKERDNRYTYTIMTSTGSVVSSFHQSTAVTTTITSPPPPPPPSTLPPNPPKPPTSTRGLGGQTCYPPPLPHTTKPLPLAQITKKKPSQVSLGRSPRRERNYPRINNSAVIMATRSE